MDTKKYVITSVAVFIVYQILSFIIHNILLKSSYKAMDGLWRPEEQINANFPILLITGLIMSFLFVFIYTKGYEGKGLIEGVRFGLWIGLFMSIPMAFNTYATMRLPFNMAIKWFIFGLIQFVIVGIITAALYKPASKTS